MMEKAPLLLQFLEVAGRKKRWANKTSSDARGARAHTICVGRGMGVGIMAACSSETCVISLTVTVGANSATGVGEWLLGAVERVGLETVLELGSEAWTGVELLSGLWPSAVAAFRAAGLL